MTRSDTHDSVDSESSHRTEDEQEQEALNRREQRTKTGAEGKAQGGPEARMGFPEVGGLRTALRTGEA